MLDKMCPSYTHHWSQSISFQSAIIVPTAVFQIFFGCDQILKSLPYLVLSTCTLCDNPLIVCMATFIRAVLLDAASAAAAPLKVEAMAAEDSLDDCGLELARIDRMIHSLQHQDEVIVKQMRGMREESLSLDMAQLPALSVRGRQLSTIGNQIHELRLSLESSSDQSARMVSHVRRVHTAHGRVQEVLSRVDQLVALERCRHSVEGALHRLDFEAAVEQVLVGLLVQQPLLDREASGEGVGKGVGGEGAGEGADDAEPREQSMRMVSSLEARLQEEIDTAAAAQDEAKARQLGRCA